MKQFIEELRSQEPPTEIDVTCGLVLRHTFRIASVNEIRPVASLCSVVVSQPGLAILHVRSSELAAHVLHAVIGGVQSPLVVAAGGGFRCGHLETHDISVWI